MSPGHAAARYALMQLHLDQQETEELRKLAEETLKVLPGDSRTLGYLNSLQSDEQIIAAAKTKAETEPTSENYLNLSLAYYNVGQYQACIDAAYKALEYQPDFAEAYNNICSAHNELKQWDLAVTACNKALQYKPDYQLAKNNLNWAKSQQ
jgi:tetratricopeptide (TPR) repeat protein